MERQPSQIGTRLRVVGRNLQCVLKIGPRRIWFSLPRFQNTEIIPAVGVLRLQAQRLALLVDCFPQLAGSCQNLGEQGVQFRIFRRQARRFPQLYQRLGGPPGLREGQRKALASVDVVRILLRCRGK